jgi:phosphoglycolate phosphatase-like HAD superfamily hydrolase
MHLVMFDIDGTLTETMKVDEECFLRSLADIYGFTGVETDWSKYKHTTDSGIFHEIHLDRTGRLPSDAEVSHFQQHFVSLLASASCATAFVPVTGACRLLSDLSASAKYRVSLATGGWSDSARLKMARAGMCFDDHPAASADDAHDRESIMRISGRRAVDQHGAPFDKTVYVGDGVWDARACRALGIPFIGIGSGERAERLLSEGAVCVFQNYADVDLVLKSLDEITERFNHPPQPKTAAH